MADETENVIEQKKEEETKEKPEVKSEELNVEALTKALREEIAESIRKEEKAKLYDSFEKYKEDARKAEEARLASEAKLKDYEQKNLSAEEQLAKKLSELEESNAKLQEQMGEIVQSATKQISTLQLELEKERLLAQYKDEIIPSMIGGNTLEELRQSAENAHREYLSITEKALAKVKAETKKEAVGSGLSPSSANLNASPSKAQIDKISDPKEWEKVRDKFLEDALKQQI